jgi:hypothetical protein
MPKPEGKGAICVQKFDDSRNSAIHTTYRALLRSSSTWEPRNPLYSVNKLTLGGIARQVIQLIMKEFK